MILVWEAAGVVIIVVFAVGVCVELLICWMMAKVSIWMNSEEVRLCNLATMAKLEVESGTGLDALPVY
jgi:hypothetical protein